MKYVVYAFLLVVTAFTATLLWWMVCQVQIVIPVHAKIILMIAAIVNTIFCIQVIFSMRR